ncbi:hypothetical protein [Kribbella sp. NPDC048915]|uniref:hypothetical protein n=1 Tax=Kribbella sp. NPDC048915 TaxID=3155148 RepID=UPI0033E7D5FF
MRIWCARRDIHQPRIHRPGTSNPGPHRHGLQQVLVITKGDKPGDTITVTITVTNTGGEILIEYTRPAPGTAYVGNAKPPGPVTEALRPQLSPTTKDITLRASTPMS